MNRNVVLAVVCLANAFGIVSPQVESIYCGKENCYDVLGVPPDATRSVINKAYRALALQHHPDRMKNEEDKKTAEVRFQKIANAYEILKDEEQRKEYDYMLANPEAFYYNYYRYFRRRYGPQVDVRIVIVIIITLISAAQYYGQSNNYQTALSELTKYSKYRTRAKEIARERGLLDYLEKPSTKRAYSKEELKAMGEKILCDIVKERMDIRGGFEKPSIYNTLWMVMLLSPWYLLKWLHFHLRWLILFNILRREYGRDEKLYLIRCRMRQSRLQFAMHSDEDLEYFMERELWKADAFNKFKLEESEELKTRFAENSRYKRYRRYMRRGGPG